MCGVDSKSNRYLLPLPRSAFFLAYDWAAMTFNDFLLDINYWPAGEPGTQIIFKTVANAMRPGGALHFYGMNQVNAWDIWSDCIGWEATSVNIYGRLLTNKLVSAATLSYHIFNTIENYQVETILPIDIIAPIYQWYDEA